MHGEDGFQIEPVPQKVKYYVYSLILRILNQSTLREDAMSGKGVGEC